MLKLQLQYFSHLIRITDSLEKTLMLGKTEGRRVRGRQRMRWLDCITDSMDIVWVNSRSWWWTGRSGVLQSMGLQKVRNDWTTDWTELKVIGKLQMQNTWLSQWHWQITKRNIFWNEKPSIVWPKSLFEFFLTIPWENLNKIFGQDIISLFLIVWSGPRM